jgi:hypothetical protein
MRTAVTAALLLGLVTAAPARADEFLADFQGWDFTWPLPSCLDCPGQYYEAQGFVGSVNPAFLNYNYVANEYTFMIGGDLFFASADTFGTTVVAHYTNGQIYLICDDRTTGTAGIFDRGGFCDPFFDRLAFVDGDTTLCGQFTSFDIVYDTVTGDGSIIGYTNWTSGSQIGNIPLSQRNGWTIGAIGIRVGPPTPCGYHWQIDGNCTLEEPVPVEDTTWGSVKQRFTIER